MSLFVDISENDFIKQYWQKKPFLARQLFSNLDDLIDGDELAGLACEQEVESRIISGKDIHGEWHCQYGPFTEDIFAKLAPSNWTLLVQGVDQWDENIRAILDLFRFLPAWRVEDIMASYAPVGGGVGPHFDYYDVFLIQISGTREWHLGQQCDENTALQNNEHVKLLAEFDIQETYQVNVGDILYIPAGLAHWGTATSNDCITFSVGFRAPSEKEIIQAVLENLAEELSENNRYQDSLQSIDEHPNKINQYVRNNLISLLSNITAEKLQQTIEQSFGQLVTDTRYTNFEDQQEEWTIEQIELLLKHNKHLQLYHYPHARFAFSETQLFVNGEAYQVDEKFSQMICDKIIDTSLSAKQLLVLVHLLNNGVLSIQK